MSGEITERIIGEDGPSFRLVTLKCNGEKQNIFLSSTQVASQYSKEWDRWDRLQSLKNSPAPSSEARLSSLAGSIVSGFMDNGEWQLALEMLCSAQYCECIPETTMLQRLFRRLMLSDEGELDAFTKSQAYDYFQNLGMSRPWILAQTMVGNFEMSNDLLELLHLVLVGCLKEREGDVVLLMGCIGLGHGMSEEHRRQSRRLVQVTPAVFSDFRSCFEKARSSKEGVMLASILSLFAIAMTGPNAQDLLPYDRFVECILQVFSSDVFPRLVQVRAPSRP